MTTLIEIRRNRLIGAKLADMVSKTGSNFEAAKLADGSLTTAEIDAEILRKALIKLFEKKVFSTHEPAIAEREIIETYGDCVNLKVGKLTDFGEGFIGAVISNLVELAFAERGAK